MAALSFAVAVAVAPASAASTAYVANEGSDNMSAFSIGADGGLSALAGSPFAAGTFPGAVAVSPDGGHLYVTNQGDNTVSRSARMAA